MNYLISACLIGTQCTYKGGDNAHAAVQALYARGNACALCPELLGGFGSPRPRTELVGGDGAGVLQGTARVVNEQGTDVTRAFVEGARRACHEALQAGVTHAILKARSPSCGVGMIYDGSFTGRRVPGNGVFAQLLIDAGITVVTEEECENSL